MLLKSHPFKYKLLLLSVILSLSSCHLIDFRSDDTLLAKAYNSRLYLEDIQGMIPKGLNPSDSVAYVKQYVDRWLVNQVFLFHATQSMTVDQTAVEQMVNDYRNALILHKYETYLIAEEMDTVITDDQIERYYEENTVYFKLSDNIVNPTYIKLPLASQEADRIRELYRSSEPEVLEELEELCLYNAATYYIGLGNWLPFKNITKDMPISNNEPDAFLYDNAFAEITDDYFRYFLYIHECRLIGDVSPLVLERDNIRKHILKHRRKQFVQNMRQNLFKQAIEANKLEVYF